MVGGAVGRLLLAQSCHGVIANDHNAERRRPRVLVMIYVVGRHQNLLEAWDAVTAWWSHDVSSATLLGVEHLGYRSQLVEVDADIVCDLG